MSNVRKMTTAALLLAIGILLPMAFHAIPNGGSIFAPMHLSVLLAGFICGPFYGALLGLLTPLFSFFFTGMPPVAVLPGMMMELMVYGAATGVFYRLVKTKNLYLDIYLALIISMLLGRAVGGLTNWLLYVGGKSAKAYSWTVFATTYFVISWPAILIQLVSVPGLMTALTKSHLISENDRYFDPRKIAMAKAAEQSAFFDKLAPSWNEKAEASDGRIDELLSLADIKKGDKVLDLACGTGVLEPFLLKKEATVIGLDLSAEMLEKAKALHHDPKLTYVQGDFYYFDGRRDYDAIICYNAYPHFYDKDAFAEKAASLLKKGGRLYIIHSMGREALNKMHSCGTDDECGAALLSTKKEAFPFWKQFKEGRLEEDENHYFIELIRR
jgi:SAM-dependent methyltransferase/predicted membrane protein